MIVLDVEDYSENGEKLVFTYKSSSRILTSSFSVSNCRGCAILALGCDDKTVYLLNGNNLTVLHKIAVTFNLENLQLPNYNVKCSEKQYFENFCIDSVLNCFDNALVVGLSTGFLKLYSYQSFEEVKVFSPIPLEYPQKEDEKVTVSIENAFISGVQSLAYSNSQELIFVNHKRGFTNYLNRTFTLPETPICVYKKSGEVVKKYKVQGDILSSRVLENRNLYLCLTSTESQVYIFNFVKSTLIKISLDFLKDPKQPLYFTGIATHEFEVSQRHQTADKVFPDGGSSVEIVDGDIVFGIENNGSILISKLIYENEEGKVAWTPLKYVNAAGNDKSLQSSIQKNVFSREISCICYSRMQDKLFFSDPRHEVVIMKNLLKKAFSGPETVPTSDSSISTNQALNK